MKKKSVLCLLLAFTLLWTSCIPVLAASETQTVSAQRSGFSFFRLALDWFKSMINRIKIYFAVKKEGVPDTMNQNAIHMLRSVTDTIGDSFIITTEDGKVIVVDGGHRTETDYFVEYLKAVTGKRRPHIDAWFLSHAHDDHCEVFLDVVEHRREVTFDKVYADFPQADFYENIDDWAFTVLTDYYRLLPTFADKAARLREGDVISVGTAQFTIFYTFNPAWNNCNEGSTIMRMDLGGTSVMFTGDAGENAGDYVVEKYADSGMLHCDYCKMAHHGQDGVGKNFYEAVAPEVCLWSTPTWVYNNTNGNLRTFETRAWVEELGVQEEYKSFEGSAVICMRPRIVTTSDSFGEGYAE